MTECQQLLADYAKNGSETAFRELVTRYIDLVFSTALRLVDGDAHRAQDTVQTVFIDLARQAPKLSPDTMLGGWLHRDTCFVAAKVMRGERRRQLRERQAAEMNALNQSDAGFAHFAPVLDEAINRLGEEDRKAILLRFYERYDLRSVGEALGSSENAAQKRVSRALEQLHDILARQGVTLSAAALATGLAAEAVTAAPAGLAASIATTAVASAAVAGGIATTFVKTMALTELKIGVIGALVAAGVATPLLIQRQSLVQLREENQSLMSQVAQLTGVAAEAERLSNLVGQANSSASGSKDQSRELLRLRGEVGFLRRQASQFEKSKEENHRLRIGSTGVQEFRLVGDWSGQTNFPRESWAFAGYTAPEAALQSGMWAMTRGDVETMLSSLTPTARKEMEDEWKGKTESQIVSELPFDAARTSIYRIDRREVISDDEVDFDISFEESPQDFGSNTFVRSVVLEVKAKRIGGEWKVEPKPK